MSDEISTVRIVDVGRAIPLVKGAWSAETAYEMLDIVSYNGYTYIAKANTEPGILPTDTEHWMLVAGSITNWGDIYGQIENQTDLKDALDAKLNAADAGTMAAVDDAPNNGSPYLRKGEEWYNADDRYYTETEMNTKLNAKANLASPTFTGTPKAPTAAAGTNTTQLATTAFVQTGLSGKSDTGHTHDDRYYTESEMDTKLAAKANLASPTFTGTPKAPNAAKGTNTQQIATTSFVAVALTDKQDNLTFDSTPTTSSTNPVTSGGVKTALDLKAPLASPTLTGTPAAPTAAKGTNTTQIATTAFVQTGLADKQNTLIFDDVPTAGSANPVKSGGVKSALDEKAIVIPNIASGDPVSFNDGTDAPAIDLKVAIEPIQGGSGDPAPDNVRPISGWKGCNVVNSRVFIPNQFVTNGDFSSTSGWGRLRSNISAENNVLKIQGNGENNTNGVYRDLSAIDHLNHIIYATGDVKGDTAVSFYLTINYGIANETNIIASGTASTSWQTLCGIMRFGQQSSYGFGYRLVTQTTAGRIPDDSYVYLKNAMIIDLTELFGEQVAEQILAMEQAEPGSGVAVVKGFFPEDYYQTNTNQSPENDGQGGLYSVTFPTAEGTIYGGSLDVTTGVLIVDRASYTVDQNTTIGYFVENATYGSYGQINLSNLYFNTNEATVISSSCKSVSQAERLVDAEIDRCFADDVNRIALRASKNITITTKEELKAHFMGTQLVYKLATPQTYQLTPTEVVILLGQNTIIADSGPVAVTYKSDTKTYIDETVEKSATITQSMITSSIESSTTASKTYSAGALIILNGQLLRATTGIGIGGTITIGSNAETVTLETLLAELSA